MNRPEMASPVGLDHVLHLPHHPPDHLDPVTGKHLLESILDSSDNQNLDSLPGQGKPPGFVLPGIGKGSPLAISALMSILKLDGNR